MRDDSASETNVYIIGAIIIHLIGLFFSIGLSERGFGDFVSFIALVIFMWGCSRFSYGKGYSPWFGLLGAFSLIGLLIISILPDKFPKLPKDKTK